MEHCKIIAIGDNVCDKYLSRGKMYPGGQCVNTCVYVKMNNMESAYLGKYGNDEVAACVQDTLKEIGIDDSHCRRYEGENGFALVTLKETDRVFLGSNKGGIAKEHDFGFTKEDLEYIKGFHLIYTNLNSYIEKELPVLYQTGVPVAYDFSTRWTDEQFILVNGKAILITAERKDGKFETELTLMEKGKVYNVPKECWFYSITQKDTKMVYVQDSGCSMDNSDFCDLSEEEIKKIQEEARDLFA